MITLYKFKDSNHTEYFIQMHEDKSLTIEYSKYGGAFEKRFLHNYEYDRKLPDLQKRLIRVFDQNTSSDILNERLQFTSFIPRSAGSEISQGLQNYQSNLAKVYLNCPFTGFDFSTLSLNEWVDNQFSYQLADFQRVTQGNSRTNRWRLNIDMQVADEELRLLADVLSKAPFVKEVFFSSSDRLTSEALVSFIGSNQTVEELAFINAGDNLVEALPEVLKKDPFLKSLRISSSKMISKGAKALFEALKTNTHLEFLELTKFGNDELVVKNLGGIFRENKSLRSLQFEECILEVSSACTLANALECNRTIESVTLGNTWLSQVALSNFAKAIAANSESRLSSFSMNVEWIPHLSQDCLKRGSRSFWLCISLRTHTHCNVGILKRKVLPNGSGI